jgi:hypothetical protein
MIAVSSVVPDFAALHPGYKRPSLLAVGLAQALPRERLPAVSCTFPATCDWSALALRY